MTLRKKNNINTIVMASVGAIGLLIICCTGLLAFSFLNGGTTKPTAIVLASPLPIETIIAGTVEAARIQTQQAMPPTLIPTSTLAPLLDAPTATIFIFELQTEVARPTDYIYATNTSFALATFPLPTSTPAILATAPLQVAACSCTGDSLNCSDFSSHASAQECFSYCKSQGKGDVHKLDQDDDGSACESLP